jgi:flavin-dependent dehydrogenase|tara:strand:+ start:53 stop:1537 length:1485 start_codon:yes stop_codon:yes gene_type:complete
MNPIKDVVIVGGGTAGLISALYIKRFLPQFNVKIIKSSSVGIIGVGEGSTEHWFNFLTDLNIDPKELINETNATIKSGILFNDWSYLGSTYCHSVNDESHYINKLGVFELYNKIVLENKTKDPYILSPTFRNTFYKNKIPINSALYGSNQYHFDTYKLNKYLIKKCLEIGILVQDAFIKDVKLNEKGYIKTLITSTNSLINGDFFIDASGFKKVLSSKLETKWESYKDSLPVNQAITLSTDLNLEKGIEPYTKATALSSGWAWKIPTQERYGNGYVFDNRYIDADNALNEFNQHLGTNIEKEAKNVKFEAGKIDKFWIKNCVSIGLAGSFAEPLEAQSIGFSIIQSQNLIGYFNNWLQSPTYVSQKYNSLMDSVFSNIVDYVQLHYFTERNDTLFWKEKPFNITDFNKNTFKRFSLGYFLDDELSYNHLMFQKVNFYQLYYGLNLLNLPQINKNLNKYPLEYLQEINKDYKELMDIEPPNSISHIDYLKLLREN